VKKPYNSLYIHIPFCQSKCHYCIFYSTPNHTQHTIQTYLNHLTKQFPAHQQQCNPLKSIFIGGGTPTILNNNQLQTLLSAINKNFTLSQNCEFTIECNPESLTIDKLKIFQDHNINRLSIGIQSFNPIHRKTLGRQSQQKQILHILDKINNKRNHFQLNLDLIYAIPNQTQKQWQQDLQTALTFQPNHISAYSLTIEEGSILAQKKTTIISDQQSIKMWQTTEKILAQAQIQRYEISNYAQPNHQCQHNLNIWYGDTYLGLGPAACSFDGNTRTTNPHSLQKWLQNTPPTIDKITAKQRAAEILAFGLRTTAGWNQKQFKKITNYNYNDLCPEAINYQIKIGMLTQTNNNLSLTPKGLLYADTVAAELLL